jgi:hypothetical protein
MPAPRHAAFGATREISDSAGTRLAVSRRVRGDGDQVDHHDRHQYYGGHAPGIAFQGERLEVFPGELLVGERRTVSSRGAARWPA